MKCVEYRHVLSVHNQTLGVIVAGDSNMIISQGSIERSLDFSGENLLSAGEGERLGGVSDRLEDLSRRALQAG